MVVVFFGCFGMIVDLHFVSIVYRHPGFLGFDGNPYEDAGIAVEFLHLVHHTDRAVLKFSFCGIQKSHTALARDHSVYHEMVSRSHLLPAGQIFPVE